MAVSQGAKSGYKEGHKGSAKAGSQGQAGLWITLIAAIVSISALEHLTKWPWYVNYPLALIAGLAITAGYIKLKQFVFGDSK